jgi:hypothetical protein
MASSARRVGISLPTHTAQHRANCLGAVGHQFGPGNHEEADDEARGSEVDRQRCLPLMFLASMADQELDTPFQPHIERDVERMTGDTRQ